MPYKSAKRSLKFWRKIAWFEFFIFTLLVGVVSKATLTITTPLSGQTYNNTAYFYAAPNPSNSVDPGPSPAATAFLDTASGFYQVNLQREFDVDPYGTTTAGFNGLVALTVTMDPVTTTLASNQRLVLMGFVASDSAGTLTGSTDAAAIDIVRYTYGSASTSAQCDGSASCFSVNSRFIGVDVPSSDSSVTIWFYPGEVCQDHPTLFSCDTSATPKVLYLKFITKVVTVSGNTITDTVDSTFVGAATDTEVLSLNFQTNLPTLSCSSLTSSSYFPGDGQISLNTNQLLISNYSSTQAPGIEVWMAGNKQTTAYAGALPAIPAIAGPTAQSLTGFTSNSMFNNVPYGGTRNFNNFTNTTESSYTTHTVVFGIKTATGLVAFPNPVTACQLSSVLTADVSGFLIKGKKCFIATAAFGSEDSKSVELLRKFRNQFLLKSQIGRKLVRFYYTYSPSAADWLIEHPLFKVPTLLILFPIQAMAYLLLNPALFLGLLGFASVMGFTLFTLRRQYEK